MYLAHLVSQLLTRVVCIHDLGFEDHPVSQVPDHQDCPLVGSEVDARLLQVGVVGEGDGKSELCLARLGLSGIRLHHCEVIGGELGDGLSQLVAKRWVLV